MISVLRLRISFLLTVTATVLLISPSLLRAGTQNVPDTTLRLIPTPQHVVRTKGRFVFSRDVKLFLGNRKDQQDQFAAGQLTEEVQAELKLRIALTAAARGKLIMIGQLPASKTLQKEVKAAKLVIPAELGSEGYIVHVAPSKILVVANAPAGVFYGVQTLKQLIRSNRDGNALPCVTIVDWPSLRYRGWMDDISRGPIPTVPYLKDVIQKMAEVKQNFFTLYTEHVFRLKSHPEIAPADGLTSEEVAELTAFAQQHHIEFIGNAQSFGHMEHMLQSPFYNKIKENPSVVTPAVEETYRFLKDEYDEIVPSYKSDLFHINCDEVYGLGTGPGKQLVDSIGMPAVYAYHINRINDLIKPYKKRILMWGDIAADNPEIIGQLPKDLVIISWGYHPAESFESAILPFKKTGFDFMVAPGVSCWNEVWPNMSTAVVNISNYVRDGARLGTMGVMNTAWDDDGENFFSYNWHGLLWGAECSWKPAPFLTGEEAKRNLAARLEIFNRSFDNLFYGADGVAAALFEFDSLRHLPVRGIVRDAGVWSGMLTVNQEDTTEDARVFNDQIVQRSKDLLDKLASLKNKVLRNAQTLDYAMFAAKRVLFTGRKNLIRMALAEAVRTRDTDIIISVHGGLAYLLDQLHSLKAEYVGLWKRENRGWWLDRILDKYDRLGTQLVDLDKTVMIKPAATVVDGKRAIELSTPFNDQSVYYTTDGSIPSQRATLYTQPFEIDRSSLVRARVVADRQSYPLTEVFVLTHKAIGRLYKLNSTYSRYNPAYAAGGESGLLDGLRGSESVSDGRWQGYQGQDLDIVIDLQKPTGVKKITVGCLQNSFSWILMPDRVQIFTSNDSVNFVLSKEIPNTVDPREEGVVIRDFNAAFTNLTTRFIKIVAKSQGKLPEWHRSAGNNSYIFADEIIVE